MAEAHPQKTEPSANELEQRFRILVDSVKDYAIFMLDADGCVQTWNQGARLIKGYLPDEIIGKRIDVFYTPEDRLRHHPDELLAEARSTGRVEEEGWRVRKDGRRFWADVVITALRDDRARIVGFAKVTRDLTERRQLDEERIARARAEESLRLKDDFLSIASHELKTPLTALRIDQHNLRERIRSEDPKLLRGLDRAARTTDRLAALIDTLMDVGRITGGELTLTRERFDLGAALSLVVEGLASTAERVGSELGLEVVEPLVGNWDRLRVEQVVMNLLANAIKYAAGQPIAVRLSRSPAGDRALIEVRDHGPGIPEKDLERIFRRFERASSARNFGGLGLGLYVSREIVEAHGGRISARNLPEGGAAFTVELPTEPPG